MYKYPARARLPKYVVLEKKRGETPLELLTAWKTAYVRNHPEHKDVLLSYAGRLDPMAEGKLLMLVGDECKKQSQYTKLDKEYEIEIVLDLKTDTGDVLGISQYGIEDNDGKLQEKATSPTRADIQKVLAKEVGAHSRKYPVYSSKTVQGKPLFLYALEGTLGLITIPEHIEHFYKLALLETKILSKQETETLIHNSLVVVPRSDEPSKVLGADFRQDEVRARWRELFSKVPDREFTIIRLRIICGSGAYMRTLAERIGVSLGTTAFAKSIKRTKIGAFVSLGLFGFQNAVSFWRRQF